MLNRVLIKVPSVKLIQQGDDLKRNPAPLITRCLCGDTSLTVIPKSLGIGVCYCDTCRKWSGGAFLAIESVRVSATGDNVRHYDASEWAERVFCQQCGATPLLKIKRRSRPLCAGWTVCPAAGYGVVSSNFYQQ